MNSHVTDWFPGRISKEYKANYDMIRWKKPTVPKTPIKVEEKDNG